jgi:hypothetical protein
MDKGGWTWRARGALAFLLVPTGMVVDLARPAWAGAAPAPVALTTTASAGAISGEVFANALLSGGDSPTGTVTFRLFGPDDDSCARSPVFTSTNPVTVVAGARQATSDRTVMPASGVYHFVASYSGDSGNAPTGPTDCRDPNAAVGWAASSFAFSAHASGPAAVGAAVTDAATIAASSSPGPTGTMTFRVFGPDDARCASSPAFTSAVPVRGNGTYTSAPFVPTVAGTYRWIASYSGDADDPTAETPCNDPAQRFDVAGAPNASSAGRSCELVNRLLGRFGGGFGSALAAAVRQGNAPAGSPVGRALQLCGT